MSKNIRNTSQDLINVNYTSTIPYQKSVSIPVSWDPVGALFGSPIASTLHCERIGDMIFIKVLFFAQFPVGMTTIVSNTGVIPVGFRPTTNQLCHAFVINGYVDIAPLLQFTPHFNTPLGACVLSTDGTLSFGTSKTTVAGPIADDGATLVVFQGPNQCGIIGQTLIFSAT